VGTDTMESATIKKANAIADCRLFSIQFKDLLLFKT